MQKYKFVDCPLLRKFAGDSVVKTIAGAKNGNV